ncbi:MAG TPA: FecR family protein [Xanthobacteraceae bacterium]|nr:FecR family protein [Xanthobacteraceae bacterium]
MFARVMAGLGLVASLVAPAAAQQIGQTVSVQNQVTGEINSVVRRLGPGDNVNSRERVSTATASTTLLRFLDQTQLNVGAASTVVLDRFVYNPDGGARDAVINITKGAMRFVTGNSNPENFTIRTQVATIGIRGTDFVTICNGSFRCAVVVNKGIVGICPGQLDRFSTSCPGYCEVNEVDNFSLIERALRCNVSQVSKTTVMQAIQAVAAGRVIDLAVLGTPPGTPPIRIGSGPAGGAGGVVGGTSPVLLEGLAFGAVAVGMAIGPVYEATKDDPITP